MSTSIKRLLYISLKLSLYIAYAGTLYSAAMIAADSNDVNYWIIRTAAFGASAVVLVLLQIIRRSKFPLAGKDYK